MPVTMDTTVTAMTAAAGRSLGGVTTVIMTTIIAATAITITTMMEATMVGAITAGRMEVRPEAAAVREAVRVEEVELLAAAKVSAANPRQYKSFAMERSQ